MVGELGMVSVGGGDPVMGIEAGEERGLVLRTGVSHSDVSGRTWAWVTTRSGCPVFRAASHKQQTLKTYYTSRGKLPRPSPELTDPVERILQVRTFYYLSLMIDDKNIIQDTGRSMASMAVGTVARATLGRMAGPIVASAVGGAVMQGINRREVVDTLTSRGKEAMAGTEERMEEGEEFRLCSSEPNTNPVSEMSWALLSICKY